MKKKKKHAPLVSLGPKTWQIQTPEAPLADGAAPEATATGWTIFGPVVVIFGSIDCQETDGLICATISFEPKVASSFWVIKLI